MFAGERVRDASARTCGSVRECVHSRTTCRIRSAGERSMMSEERESANSISLAVPLFPFAVVFDVSCRISREIVGYSINDKYCERNRVEVKGISANLVSRAEVQSGTSLSG